MVAQKIQSTKVGKEGAVVCNPNGLKIVPAFDNRQRISPTISTPVDVVAASSLYYDRRFLPNYEEVNIIQVSGLNVSVADFK